MLNSGDEADKLNAFKAALGLSDEEAAPAHLDLGRRLYRQGFETKDRQQQFEQKKVRLHTCYGGGLSVPELRLDRWSSHTPAHVPHEG